MPVNIYDIARKSGLSVVTVSRVLNNYPNVREANRRKVEAAIRELDYKPNAAARSLSSGKTGMIALVVPYLQDAFLTQVIYSVEMSLRKNGMFMIVTSAPNQREFTESFQAKLFLEGRVDGILILTPVSDNGYVLELKKRSIPVVLLDQHQSGIHVPSVTVDNFLGGYEATMHLIKCGSKRIAHISGPHEYQSSRERTNGYMRALEESGIKVDENLLVKGDFSVSCGYNAMKGWIDSGNVPDAVFAADDNTAFGVLDAARSCGIRVPQQVSIIGYDNHPYGSALHPTLSTVGQPAEEMGSVGVELLLDIIGNKPRRIPRIVLKPTLILRETTV